MKLPQVGERVYVLPYCVPGHEQPGYSGTVSQIFSPDHAGRTLVGLVNCNGGRGTSRTEWLRFISGYQNQGD